MQKASLWSIIICYCFATIVAVVYYPKYTKSNTESTLSWDVAGYYTYLPALFIYKDVQQLHFTDSIRNTYNPSPDYPQAVPVNGNKVIRYNIGQAVLMSPFFAIAHIYTTVTKSYTADGFSKPYQVAIGLGMLLYSFIGLWFLRKVLLHFYTDGVTAITLLCFTIGTNWLNYGWIDHCMSHASLFMLYSILLWQLINIKNFTNYKAVILLGCTIGLMALIRLPELIAIGLVALWFMGNAFSLKNIFSFFTLKNSVLFITSILLMLAPQIIYWQYVAHTFYVNSYNGFGFSWLHPHIQDYAWSYTSGWLRYTPMLIIGVLGLLFLQQKRWAIILFCLVAFYITSAWDVWTYGGRAMVQYYPVFAIAFAAITTWALQYKFTKTFFALAVIICSYINIWWTHQAHRGSIPLQDITRKYYNNIIGRWSINAAVLALRDACDLPPSNNATLINTINKNTPISIDSTTAFGNIINTTIAKNTNYFSITTLVQCTNITSNTYAMPQLTLKQYSNGIEKSTSYIRLNRTILDTTLNNITLHAKAKNNIDSIQVYIWNANGATVTKVFATTVKCYQ